MYQNDNLTRISVYLPLETIKDLKASANEIGLNFGAYCRMLLIQKNSEIKGEL